MNHIYIQDYKTVLSSLSLSKLRIDILSCVKRDGYLRPLNKRKNKKGKKSKRYYDDSIVLDELNSKINYYSKKRKVMFKTYFRHFIEYSLLLTLSIHSLPISSLGVEYPLNKMQKSVDIPDEYFMLHLSDAVGLQNPSIDMLTIDTNPVEITPEPVEENHDDEYREAIYNFLVKEEITLDQFSNLLTLMVEGNSPFPFTYKNELEVFLDLCFRSDRSTEEKMLITMIRDNISYDELDSVCAGCVSEAYSCGECYDDAYAVASTILNRIHDTGYVGNYGTNPYNQFIAPDQFSVYASKDYLNYLGCRDLPAYKAAVDALYSRESMHRYLEFRASWVDVPYSHESFVEGGNQFLVKQKDSRYLPDEEIEIDREEIMSLVLEYPNE